MQRHRFTLRLSLLISERARQLCCSGTIRPLCSNPQHLEPNDLSCRSLCLLRRAVLSGSCTRIPDTANNGLVQVVDALFFVAIHHPEAKLGFALGPFANTNG